MRLNYLHFTTVGPGSAYPPVKSTASAPFRATNQPGSGQLAQPLSGGFMMQAQIALPFDPAIIYQRLPHGPGPIICSTDVEVQLAAHDADGNLVVGCTLLVNVQLFFRKYDSDSFGEWVTALNSLSYSSTSPAGAPTVLPHDPIVSSLSRERYPGTAGYGDAVREVGEFGGNVLNANNFRANVASFHVFSPLYHVFVPAGATLTATASASNFNVIFNYALLPVAHQGTFTAITSGNTSLKAHIYGLGTRAAFRPRGQFTSQVNHDDMAADFTDTSTDYDGTVVAWDWTFFEGIDDSFPSTSSTLQHPHHAFNDAGSKLVRLVVRDNDGGLSETIEHTISIDAPSPFSALQNDDGTVLLAIPNITEVLLLHLTGPIGGKTVRSRLEGYRNPKLWRREGGRLMMAAESRSDGTTRVFYSDDDGRSFE